MSAIVDRLLCVFNPPKRYDEPKDWPQRKKNIIVLIIAYCAFTAPLGNSIYMPAAVEMQRDFDTTPTLISASVSVYVLVIGILPMFWASLCDYMGRRPIYIISLTIAIFGSIGCALAKSIGVFLAMRVFLGLGSSSVVAVGGGTLSDVFHPGERGTALGLFYLGPLVSPIVGPLVGGVLAEAAGWRSTMWFMLSCVVLAWLLVVLVLPETHRDRVDGKIINPPSSTNIEELSNEEQPPTASPSAIEGVTIDRPPSPCTSEAERTVTEAAVLELRPTAKEIFTTSASTTGSSAGEGALASPLKSLHGPTISAPIEHKQLPTDSIELADRSLPKGHLEEQLKQPGDHVQESTPTPNNGSAQSPSQKKPRFFNPLRPLVCLKHRINILAVMFNAFGLGGQVCLINTIPVTFHDLYHLSESKIGLSMMSLGCGLAIGSVLGGRYSDFVVRRWLIKQERRRNLDCENPSSLSQGSEGKMKQNRLDKMSFWLSKKKHGATTTTTKEGGHKDQRDENGEAFKSKVTVATRTPPEVRLRSTWLGAIFLPLGFLMYGWAVERGAPIAIPLLGCFFAGFGMMMVMSSTTTVLVDANAENNMAAAAVSCSSCMRGIVGAIGGILSLPMMNAMGNGWLYTLWAAITTLGFFGVVIVIIRAAAWRQQKRMKRERREARE